MRALLIGLAVAAGVSTAAAEDGLESAIVAGGCFWCVESDFDKVAGVVETVSGYSGGETENPTYQQVIGGGTGHREVVRIVYDPEIIDYPTLIAAFLRTVDVVDGGGQFCDRGFSYSTAIYADGPMQRAAAEAAIAEAEAELGAEVVTPVEDAGAFWPAEDYHQDYYLKNPTRYGFYRASCGRDRRVRRLWGEDAGDALKPLG